MKTLLLTIVVLLHDHPREEYVVEYHAPGAILPSTADVGFFGNEAFDRACQREAEKVLEGLQWGPANGLALLPGNKFSIHYRIDLCENEL